MKATMRIFVVIGAASAVEFEAWYPSARIALAARICRLAAILCCWSKAEGMNCCSVPCSVDKRQRVDL